MEDLSHKFLYLIEEHARKWNEGSHRLDTLVPGVTRGGDSAGSGYTCENIPATYAELFALFGPLTDQGDAYKISTRWVLTFEETVFTVYDWKATWLYSVGEPCVETFREQDGFYHWHVGSNANATNSVNKFITAMNTALGALRKEGSK